MKVPCSMVGHGRNRNRKPAFRFAAMLHRLHLGPAGALSEQIVTNPPSHPIRHNLPCAAFTLIEVMTGTVVTTIMLVSLYVGFTFGFREMQLAREEARATQILQ